MFQFTDILLVLGESFKITMIKYEKQIKKIFQSQLKNQMDSTVAKLDINILEGCFNGLERCLKTFPFDLNPSVEYL